MKQLLPIVCSLFYTTISYAIEEPSQVETLPGDESQLEEVAVLEPSFLAQPLISQEEIDLSMPEYAPKYKSPFITTSLAMIFPGLGHAYLEDYRTAGTLLGSSAVLTGLARINRSDVPQDGEYSEERLDEPRGNQFFGALQGNTWLYGVYAAYRDVRSYNDQVGYAYKMPTESLSELALAPFQWSVLKKPEVWGGYLGAFVAASTLVYFTYSKHPEFNATDRDDVHNPLVAFPVGIGEETFFRGYLQSMLSETFSPTGGIILSSLLFAAAHIPNAMNMPKEERHLYYKTSLPLITSFGLYFGWLTYKNQSLKESVAIHSWYDFTLFLISYSAVQSAALKRPSFAISIPF